MDDDGFKSPTDPSVHALWVIRNWTQLPKGNLTSYRDIVQKVHALASEVVAKTTEGSRLGSKVAAFIDSHISTDNGTNMTLSLRYTKKSPYAKEPTYASIGAACFDLRAAEGVTIGSWAAATVDTGLAFEIPPGYVMLVFSRSGHGFKNGVRLANCTGVIDSDYRGSVMVRLHNDGLESFAISPGDRIAQAMIVQAPQVQFVQTAQLSETERGAGGFGSTGND